MSQLTKSLEKRIQELKASIDAQKTELTAYEHVLHMELTKGSAPAEAAPVADEVPATVSHGVAPAASEPDEAPMAKAPAVEFSGNKTSMVAEIVKSYGTTGATPKDVDAYFTAKNISRSKNLVYNTLSYLVAQKKLQRKDGKYFTLGASLPRGRKKKVVATASMPAPKTKRRLSPEGLKRIKEALKKRWADKRAAEAASGKPATKKATKKKA